MMENPERQPSPHARAEPYCFLCHRLLPSWPLRHILPTETFEEWEHELVAVHALGSVVRADRVTLPGQGTNHHYWPRLESDHVKLCWASPCSHRHLDEPLYTAHQDCWNVARSLHRTVSSLFLVAQSRRQIFPLKYSTRPDVRVFIPDGGAVDTPLENIFGSISRRLPTELQDEVSKHLRGHLVASLSQASLATPSDERGAFTCKTPSWERAASSGEGGKINIKTSQILGLEYISEISLGGPVGVDATGLRGIRFALDTFGVRAIRVLFSDRSQSPWLGDHRFSWYGEVYGSDLAELRVIRDACRVIRLDFGLYVPQILRVLPCELWSRESALDAQFNYTAANLEQEEPPPAFYSGWSLYPYISFGGKGEYMSGLTAYCSSSSIRGLATHGSDPQSIGSKDGFPMHVALQPHERIVSAWVCTEGPPSKVCLTGPYILVTTSLGRSHFLGPYYLIVSGQSIHWTPLVKEKAEVLGLSLLGRSSIGVTWKPSSDMSAAQTATTVRPERWPPIAIGMHVAGLFLTTGTLLDTSRLQVRRCGDRCVGLSIYHNDGSMDILGSWDPDDREGIVTIYDKADSEPLTRVAFCLTDFKKFYRVTDIIPLAESSVVPHGCRVFPMTTVAWWFSDLYDDVVQWRGEMQPVHEISPLSKASICQCGG